MGSDVLIYEVKDQIAYITLNNTRCFQIIIDFSIILMHILGKIKS